MVAAAPLSTIIALARAGALDHAWYQFGAAGYDRSDDDPAALTVKGRLLKDKALRARGEERRRLYLESAQAYRRSAELQPGTYPLINAATLSLLSGDRGQSEEIAREVLDRIAREPDEPETPYWRAATEAEALLLLGRSDEARAALEAAVAVAPRAWEDHASTLRQFILIHDVLGGDPAWLDLLRPPRSLSYSGPAGGAGADADAAGEFICRERIGFGFGGLAAGFEIEVAERLLAAGAELHLVLPGDPESFARRWVDPFGPDWRRRFDAALAAAETVHQLRPVRVPPDAAMLDLARQVALGTARLNAARLITESRELAQSASESGQSADPRAGGDRRTPLVALLSLSVGAAADEGFDDRLGEVQQVLADSPGVVIAPYLSGDEVVIGFAAIADAAAAADALRARLGGRGPLQIAGHYGFTAMLMDPFLSALRPSEEGSGILRAIAQAAPPDTVCVSLDFAAALAAGVGGVSCASWIGELHAFDGGTPIPLYAVRADTSDD